ncbi:aminoglycoside phosphotransferase family protein [Mycetocola zhadangensis]|uniref:aminoglycoside phosphotransferase family protein n=1 Tax=Mycetocola zhadangensis TaxID=1164595 RepID=UPI0019A5EAED|nr:aminoglycoside phosphotransferase family protein [Mycetocola zhadangensis]GGE86896.1 hypothetical protein GCM10011313_06740 [Mycetocola zhadangensis]
MPSSPVADIDVSPELVRRLLRAQHPELSALPLELVTNGWDNTIYRLGTDLVVRLPRRQVAAELLRNEQRWLPDIAARVEVAVPRPLRIGTPTPWFPWFWTVSTWFDGTIAASLPRSARAGLAESLAGFLTNVHIPAPEEAPKNRFRGVPLEHRHADVMKRLDSDRVPDAAAVSGVWHRAVAAPAWDGPPLWLHGDLHPANLVTVDGSLAAVLDFGDLTAGDPAMDLAAA